VALSAKHRAFVEAYLETWNATEAYRCIYPKSSRDGARRRQLVELIRAATARKYPMGHALTPTQGGQDGVGNVKIFKKFKERRISE